LVPTFAKIVFLEGVRHRCALIGYSRHSLDEFLAQRDVHGNYIDFICEEYETFKEEIKHLSPALFLLGELVVNCIPKFVVVKNPCNLDHWGHYSSIIEATLLLDRKYKLNLPEQLSLLRAMAVTPSSSYLYVAAATSLLHLLKKFFDDKQEQLHIKSDDVISNVMAALKTRYWCNFLKRNVENIVCKVFRRHTKNNSDGLFHDVLIPKQNLYSVHGNHVLIMSAVGNHVLIMSADGHSTQKLKGPLLTMIPFGGKYITMEELRTHVPHNWPSWEPTIAGVGRTFLEGLFNGRRGDYPDFQFKVNTKIPNNQWLLNKFVATENW
jgi:hypothetical protein